ncbi:MAG: DUF5668 domain-containing protein [candidate division Zixibacteria bacterium]|nr:DUF5668 domain-containing protein [candidate division Zixibacteria bacterium]
MIFGYILIIVGAVFLLNHLGVIDNKVWGIIWPLVLIAWGFAILTGWRKGKQWGCCWGGRQDKNTAPLNKEGN